MSTWIRAKVVYGKNQSFDISDRIERLRYSSNTDQDNTAEFTIKKDYSRELADEDRIITGNFLVFSWGISGGKSSPVIRMKISNTEPRYLARVTLTILCSDIGNTAKKVNGNDVVKTENAKTFLDDVLKPFAEMYGLTLAANEQQILESFDPTTVGSQGHQSQYNWLKRIANKNGYMCFIDNKSLVFKKRELIKKPYKSFVYNNGDGDLIGFLPKFRETTEESSAGQVQTLSVDPVTGESNVKTSGDNQDSLGTNLNKYGADAQFAGTEGGKQVLDTPTYNGNRKVIVAPESNANQAMVDKMNLDAQMDQHTADFTTIGDPHWFADTIVTVSNVDRRNAGNWYTKSVIHDVPSDGPYLCTAAGGKYGSMAPNKVAAVKTSGKVNTEVGGKNGNVKKVVPQYDSNASTLR
jgi:hypothetical protein